MLRLFLVLTAVNLLCLLIAAGMGFANSSGHREMHLLSGVLATMVCTGVHCIVFTYFIATAKWVQHAIQVKGLDPRLAAPTRSFKAQAFPAALVAMTIVFVTAVLGAATDNYPIDPMWHMVLAMTAIGVNTIVAFVEYRAIASNARLIDAVLAMIADHQTS